MATPYCDVDDVRRQMGVYAQSIRANSTGHPDVNDVENFVLDVSEEIDAPLAKRGVTLPVAAPEAFLRFLRVTAALGAAARTVRAAFPQRAGQPSGTSFDDDLDKKYDARIARLEDGSAIPADVIITAATAPLPRSFQSQHPDDPPADPDPDNMSSPQITRGMQW